MPSLDELNSAARLRETIVSIAKETFEELNPPVRHATVMTIDTSGGKVGVTYPDEAGVFTVKSDVAMPSVGSIVRVAGKMGSRYVDYRLSGGTTINGALTVTGSTSIVGSIHASTGHTVPDNSNIGFTNVSGTSWFRPQDTGGNLHLKSAAGGVYLDGASHNLRNAAGTARLTVDASGNTTVAGYLYATSGAVYASTAFTFTGDQDSGCFFSSDGNWFLRANNVNIGLINGSGIQVQTGHLSIPGNGGGSAQVRLGGIGDAQNIVDYINSSDAGLPYANGPRLAGSTGWSFYHNGSGYRMGFRGNGANNTRYLWCADFTILGSVPNDAYATHTLRIQGSQYVSGSIDAGGGVNSAGGTYTQPLTINYTGGSAPVSWGAQNVIMQGSPNVGISFHVPAATFAPYLRHYQGLGRIDCSDSAGTAYATIGAQSYYTNSSINFKKDLEEFEDDDILVKAFWAKTTRYKLKNHEKGVRPTARFRDVDARWQARGHAPLTAHLNTANIETVDHDCTIDGCEGTEESPCRLTRRRLAGRVGPTAEDVFNLWPEAAAVDETGAPEGIYVEQLAGQALGIAGALTRKLTEAFLVIEDLQARLAVLESN